MEKRETMTKYKGKVKIINEATNEVFEYDNIVVIGFYTLVSQLMTEDSQPLGIDYLGIGTGSSAEDIDDTALASEHGSRLQAISRTYNGSEMTFTFQITGSDALFTWRELGLFNASTSGIMTNRTVINFTHSAGQPVTIIWIIDKA